MAKTPCHLIAGPLGVGKTTAILDYLKQKPDQERIAVLVNDFGANGLDETILREGGQPQQGDLKVTPVPGGCLCCTSAVHFEGHLKNLAADESIDRIIIEPSGIVMLDQMKSLLHDAAARYALDLRPVIVLINAARYNEQHYVKLPYFEVMAREADILVANRCDQANSEQVDAFTRWAHALPGRKEVFTTSFGQLPFDVITSTGLGSAASSIQSSADHQQEYKPGARQWPATQEFDGDAVERLLSTLSDTERLFRLKAILRVTAGWKLFEIAQGEVFVRDFPVQESSRVDWIAGSTSDQEAISQSFEECIMP